MQTTNVSVRVDANLKKQSEQMFAEMGLNMTTAINIFLRQVVRKGKIPFEITANIPNEETKAAIEEMEDIIKGKIAAKKYSSVEELFEDLEA